MRTTVIALALLLPLTACGGGPTTLNGNTVGQRLAWGGPGCDDTLKKLLRDPESLHVSETVVTEATPTSWTARMNFGARNGFGGMNQGVADCSFDGKEWTVQMVSGQ
jgi:hypothetical protein